MPYISGQELFQWYQTVSQQAEHYDISPLEIQMLITELTDIDVLEYKLRSYQQKPQINSQVTIDQLNDLWEKRTGDRTPIQYLLGKCYWRDFCFQVTPDVLIPRPETELIIDLVENIIHRQSKLQQGNLLDLGTGSGAIAIALAKLLGENTPHQVFAVDRSEDALKIAQQNASKYNVNSQIVFAHGSWFEPIKGASNRHSFSVIVSNPPYIPSDVVTQLQPEVVNHEPKMALDGGADGLDDIRQIISQSVDFLKPEGFVILEMMSGQGEQVKQLFMENGHYDRIEIHYDFANHDRFVSAQKIKG